MIALWQRERCTMLEHNTVKHNIKASETDMLITLRCEDMFLTPLSGESKQAVIIWPQNKSQAHEDTDRTWVEGSSDYDTLRPPARSVTVQTRPICHYTRCHLTHPQLKKKLVVMTPMLLVEPMPYQMTR